jgi:hypothetical protein
MYYYYIIINVTIHQSMIYTTKTTSLSNRSANRNAPTLQLTFCSLSFLTLSLSLFLEKRVRTKGWYLKTYNSRKLQNLQM